MADAERILRQEQVQQARLLGERYAAAVRFVKALGGGWESKIEYTRDN